MFVTGFLEEKLVSEMSFTASSLLWTYDNAADWVNTRRFILSSLLGTWIRRFLRKADPPVTDRLS